MRGGAAIGALALAGGLAAACGEPPPATPATSPAPAATPATAGPVEPARATARVAHDPDDPAVWVHPTDPGRSLILGTDKIERVGGLYVFGLDGAVRQTIAPLDRPNNVDVEYGVDAPGGPIDIAVVTERMRHRLRVFRIHGDDGRLEDLAPRGLPVLGGMRGDRQEPMGIALYKRPRDGAVFAIVAPKLGGAADYLWQYRLRFDAGAPTATLVRRFGAFSRLGPRQGVEGEIEAVAVDDELGYVVYADERFALRKWPADPDDPARDRELAVFGREHYLGDREGLAILRRGDGTGLIVSSDQVDGGTRLMIYPRQGRPGAPHDHPLVAIVPTTADATDGLEVLAEPLPGFDGGLLVMMNSRPRNFLLFPWAAVASRLPADGPAAALPGGAGASGLH
jgi:3-phytase